MSLAKNRLGDAAEERSLHAAAAVAAHDDELCFAPLGELGDGQRRGRLAQDDGRASEAAEVDLTLPRSPRLKARGLARRLKVA